MCLPDNFTSVRRGLLRLKTVLHRIPQQGRGEMSTEGRSSYFQFLLLRCYRPLGTGLRFFFYEGYLELELPSPKVRTR